MAAGLPRPDHVVIVVEENHSYGEILGPAVRPAPVVPNLPATDPYIRSLARRGTLPRRRGNGRDWLYQVTPELIAARAEERAGTTVDPRAGTDEAARWQAVAAELQEEVAELRIGLARAEERAAAGERAAVAEIAAKEAGLKVAGHEGWDANASNYKALYTKIKATGADGIFVGGISCYNGGQLIKDKVGVLGDNEAVKVVVSDGFVVQSLFEEAGEENLEGAYGSAPTLNPDDLPGPGKEFNAKVEAQFGAPEVYTAYAVAAVQMLLSAIEESDGTRESVTENLLSAEADTVVGPLSFDENGDPADKFESIFQAKGGKWVFVEQFAAPE